MDSKTQIAFGIAATVAVAVIEERLPDGGVTLLIVAAGLTLISAMGGQRLSLFTRVFATGTTFYLGYVMCLVGRTMEPGFTLYTVQTAFLVFCIYASLPTLALLRIWRGRVRVVIVASVFPVSLAAASAVAGYEEKQFVSEHPNGIGITKRWTVSNHWLAYDAETKRLNGGD
jgi:hypothetical protein